MWSKIQKAVTVLLAAAILITSVNIPAAAAEESDPYYKNVYTEMYENLATKGVYTLTVKNLKKGYIIKWGIVGGGKPYASIAETTTKVTKTYALNEVVINSNGESLNGRRINIKAKVYDSKKQLITTLSMIAALKCKATAIDIDTTDIEDLDKLAAGQSYALNAVMTPANTTSTAYWEITDAAGRNYDDEITANGVWTPKAEGIYTITAYARNTPTGKLLCKKSIQAVVGTYIETVTQTASNKFEAAFNNDVSDKYKASDFTVKSKTASVLVQQVKYSADGKTATVTTSSNFTDGMEYTVSCGVNDEVFTASVGTPVTLAILTSAVQVEKETPIEAALYDAQGMDVTNTVDANAFTYEAEVTNGVLNKETNALYMQTVGKTAKVTVFYNKGAVNLSDTKEITCIEAYAQEAVSMNFTITDSSKEPDYKTNDVRTAAIGDEVYAHFRALDEDDKVITYDSVSYASSDVDTLIIDRTSGRMTPIKNGSVNIIVTAVQGNASLFYTFIVTISEGRQLTSVDLDKTAVMISNVYEYDYQEKIKVIGRDQYGGVMNLTDEVGTVFETSNRNVLAAYDAQNNEIVIKAQGALAGTYQYVLELTQGNVSITKYFTVVVQAPSYNDAVSYRVVASDKTMDMAIDAQTSSDKTITLKVAEYRGSVFYRWQYFTSAVIRKGNRYYAADLKQNSSSPIAITGSNTLTLTPVSFTNVQGDTIRSCQKAQAGTYAISLMFVNYSGVSVTVTESVDLTDSQEAPGFVIRNAAASKRVKTALELVNDCLSVSDGTIIDCTVTGRDLTGDAVSISASEQIHIEQITVRTLERIANGESVYIEHIINVDKTLENHA